MRNFIPTKKNKYFSKTNFFLNKFIMNKLIIEHIAQ